MHRRTPAALLVVILALPLAGCGGGLFNYDFDPAEMIPSNLLNTKKPLPGERKAVFPEGVPGTAHGIPPELVKGYQPTAESAQDPLANSRQASASEEKPKPKPAPKAKPKPAPRTAAITTQGTPAGSTGSTPPVQRQPAPAQGGAPQWPDPPSSRPSGAVGAQPGGVQWPDPPPVR